MNKRQKILIVDDAKFNRDILKEFLGETYDYLDQIEIISSDSNDEQLLEQFKELIVDGYL